ncbi:MAG TPA: type VI secretion system tip protein TssI/VgrG [Gemmataceae bacterium]|jgi:type VI secretion system secreted protein VgrG
MATSTQTHRLLQVTTPLGPDVLLLLGFSGREALSRLFRFDLELLADSKKEIAFDKLLGQKILVSAALPNGKQRFFGGICSSVSEGGRDEKFTHYKMEMVPQAWLLTQRVQSRIFQHISVPDILKKVFTGFDVAFEIQGTFHPRDYCVQYRESDFDFASRLMEEEGIFYFFKHAKDGHKMVVANTSQSHPEVPEQSKAIYEEIEGGVRGEMRIQEWEKGQELRSGKYTLWDHCFELPHKHLEAEKLVTDAIQVGKVNHKLLVSGNDKLEVYDYPGGYAQRFDGVDAGGGDKPADLQKIFEDNKRTVEIRIQQTALPGLYIRGASDCRQFVSGHKFTLERHFNADGAYVLTEVEHKAMLAADYRSGEGDQVTYENRFTCIPLALPFRPSLVTEKPVVKGTQTAVVVGPAGDEIFTDKYSRIKVQFHWDRQGKYNADSSCWIRVATNWAGKGWGFLQIPRIGQEVIVDFLEGDPDNPIVIGSVYNAEQMPAGKLPAEKNTSGLKTNSTLGGGGYNGLVMTDTKGKEMITLHGQKDMSTTIEHDETVHIMNNRTETVDNNETITIHANRTETVDQNESITVSGNRTRNVAKNESVTVALTRTHTVGINEAITVGAAQQVTVGALRALTVGASQTTNIGASHSVTVGAGQAVTVGAGQTVKVAADQSIDVGGSLTEKVAGNYEENVAKSKKAEIGEDMGVQVGKHLSFSAGEQIVLKTGDAEIIMKKDGTIQIKGKDITIEGSGKITGKAASDMVLKGGSKITLN